MTASPTATSDSWAVLSAIVTTCRSDVAARTGPAAGPPRAASTLVTRRAAGSNATEPERQRPRRAGDAQRRFQPLHPAAVSQEK